MSFIPERHTWKQAWRFAQDSGRLFVSSRRRWFPCIEENWQGANLSQQVII